MEAGWKSRSWIGLWVVLAALAWVVSWPGALVYADSIGETITSSFGLHGYVENQEIIRSENFVTNYHVASIRNRIDLQPSGAILENYTIPTFLGLPPMKDFSVNYFMELRPGYEGVYDLVTDRFGNHTTGFTSIGASPFDSTGQKAGLALLNAFGYDPRRFKGVVARNLEFPEPVGFNISNYRVVNGVATSCWNCFNATQSVDNLRFERDDSNQYYYPLREAYLDFRWDFFGSNLLRLGKQQIVWGKADFFRLQDIVNPVDFGQHFFIEPFEDTRIPQLSAWLQHRFGDILGLQDVAGNFIWNFDTFNPVGLGVGGQPWAVNFGDQKKAFGFDNSLFDAGLCGGSATPGVCNPNHVNFGLDHERIPNWNIKNSGIGTKWDFQLPHPAIRFALTDYWAIGQTPVFAVNNLQVIGNGLGGIASGSNFPQSGINCAAIAHISKGFPGNYGPGGGGASIIATQARWIRLNPNISPATFMNNCAFGGGAEIRYHKDNTLGLSADYFEPHTGVVIRVESSWTHNALLNDTNSLDWTTNNDILQYVVGFDKPHFIKFLNPDRTFFSSFQIYETYYPGAHSEDGGRTGLVTGTNDFTFTAFTQTHYFRDQIIPLIFAAFGTEGTDATIGGNTEWLISDHWSATIGFDAFLGKTMQQNLGMNAVFQKGFTTAANAPYSPDVFGPARSQAGGGQKNVDDEFWTRLRYRF
jgi:hypothetical protein